MRRALALTASMALMFAAVALTQEIEEALLGFDPIELIRGQEVFGDEQITATHGGYRYLFASEDNKELFLSDPERYGIQLGGLCARMGGTTGGDSDRYTVFDGRIYIFGSDECLERFEESPHTYLPPEPAAPLAASASGEEIARGRALMAEVAEAHAAAPLETMTTYVERGTITRRTQTEEVELPIAYLFEFPDRFRRERSFPGYGVIADIKTGDDAFYAGTTSDQAVSAAQAAGLVRLMKQRLAYVLRARSAAADFVTAARGNDAKGRAVVEVEFEDLRMSLAIDGGSGRVEALSWVGRGTDGDWGQIVYELSDYREVDGVSLPFRRAGSFNGEPVPAWTMTVTDIEIDGGIDPSLFERRQ